MQIDYFPTVCPQTSVHKGITVRMSRQQGDYGSIVRPLRAHVQHSSHILIWHKIDLKMSLLLLSETLHFEKFLQNNTQLQPTFSNSWIPSLEYQHPYAEHLSDFGQDPALKCPLYVEPRMSSSAKSSLTVKE